MSADLFSQTSDSEAVSERYQPLAARLRPRKLSDYLGQKHLLGQGKPLRLALEQGQVHSMILWGPPGVGKTSLAKLLAHEINAHFMSLSAVLAGVKEIRASITEAEQQFVAYKRKSILFVDEVHRFNKAQQDAFLPYVEDGTIIFVGATTENPSFEVNNALLSRCRVYVLKSFTDQQISELVHKALSEPKGLAEKQLTLAEGVEKLLITAADGDARRSLNLLEIASDLVENGGEITLDIAQQVLAGDVRRFDKGGDLFYEQISALHKSVRGSDPDASLYWFVRMLDGGCDPLYIARRVVRMASEDIGNADPRGLQIALNAWDVQQRLGSPEGELAIAQAVVYLASAAKSNAVYSAFKAARSDIQQRPSYDVPNHLRNAPTAMMKDMEFGKGYRYAHDEPGGFAAGEHYFPDEMGSVRYYEPVERGLEIQIGEKLRRLRALNMQAEEPNN